MLTPNEQLWLDKVTKPSFPRQDSTTEQLKDLLEIARRLKMYDAVEAINNRFDMVQGGNPVKEEL